MRKNVTALKEYGKKRTEDAEKKVLQALNAMRRNEEKITIAAVARVANVTPNFIYTHPDILETVKKYAVSTGHKKVQTQDSKDVLISCQKKEIQQLKKRIKILEGNENYREKFEKAQEEISNLKKELENALNSSLDLNY